MMRSDRGKPSRGRTSVAGDGFNGNPVPPVGDRSQRVDPPIQWGAVDQALSAVPRTITHRASQVIPSRGNACRSLSCGLLAAISQGQIFRRWPSLTQRCGCGRGRTEVPRRRFIHPHRSLRWFEEVQWLRSCDRIHISQCMGQRTWVCWPTPSPEGWRKLRAFLSVANDDQN